MDTIFNWKILTDYFENQIFTPPFHNTGDVSKNKI